jgi:glucose/mannose-6-phosphate isomerase
MFIPLVILMQKIGLVTEVSVELDEALKLLEKISADNLPQKPAIDNFAKTLALTIGETVPVIYGFGFYRAVAQRFKQQINENAKTPAKWEVFPELNHNEIVGWGKSRDSCKEFSVILLRDEDEPVEIKSRIETTKQIMGNSGLKMVDLQSKGKSTLAKILSTIIVADFTSNYLAVLHGVDPTPVEIITHLKGTLQQNGFKEKIIKELEKI